MSRSWKIAAEWEHLDEGSAEERSCFAALGIQARGSWLTEGQDAIANRLRQKPLLSAYHLAEWFAWNWWRLRWEPRASNEDWRFAHKTSNIGHGYLWPNITIFSDGRRTALISKPTRESGEPVFRYINDVAAVIPSIEFEAEVDAFVDQVLQRLDLLNVADSNLAKIWTDVCEERRDPKLTQARKLEALLGKDPDEPGESLVDRLLENASAIGMSAVEELAADRGISGDAPLPSASELSSLADRIGVNAALDDAPRLSDSFLAARAGGKSPAWRVGASAAQELRGQEGFGEHPLTDERLTQMLGVEPRIVDPRDSSNADMSFVLDQGAGRGRIILRSKWHSGRRFELARLFGDRLLNRLPSDKERLYPATRSFTYRQKAQRAFAAELLSPFSAVMQMLAGDYSLEKQQDVAEHFAVSELTIRTQLVNHKILDREDTDILDDSGVEAAA
jgi:hypothetical protein